MEKIRPEWSHKIDADDIGRTPLRTFISASPQERKDIARRLNLGSVSFLEAKLVLERNPKTFVLCVKGNLKAAVIQACAVSLDPVTEKIKGEVKGWFADHERIVSITKLRHERQGRIVDAELAILEEKDDPEPILEGQIDLGELVTQHLSLLINPFLRKEGVLFEQGDTLKNIPMQTVRTNPFVALKEWKKNRDKKHDKEN